MADTDRERWDRRYADHRIWSGSPNGALVAELDGAPPGAALDVGAGEGGDALWLAERGWAVTASESPVRLALVSARGPADSRNTERISG